MSVTRFLALAPQRDAQAAARRAREALFRRGFAGAWSFPALVPLARLRAPLGREALRAAALALRAAAPADGFFRFEKPAAFTPGEGPALFGLALAAPERGAFDAALAGLAAASGNGAEDPGAPPPLPCGTCLFVLGVAADERGAEAARAALEENPPPPLAFRAAACANLAVEPLPFGESAYSFRWRAGAAAWLPKKAGETGRRGGGG